MSNDVTKRTRQAHPPREGRAKGQTSETSIPHLSRTEAQILTLLAEKPLLSSEQIVAIRVSEASWTARLLGQLEKRELLAHAVAPGQVDVPRSQHYYLTGGGIRALARREGMAPGAFAQEHWLSPSRLTMLFNALDHTRNCHQFFVDLLKQGRQRSGEALAIWLGEAAASRHYRWHGETKLLRPDGYGVYRKGAQSLAFFLEWDNGNSGIKRHRRKLRAYHEYAARLEEATLPAILAVTTRGCVRQLNRAAIEVARYRRDQPLSTLIAVRAELEEMGAFGCRWWDVRAQREVTLESAQNIWITAPKS